MPDNVLGVAQNRELLHRLDAAFFRVGEARGGLLVKFSGGETETSDTQLRGAPEENGLEVERLESEGRFRLVPERKPLNSRGETLRNLLKEETTLGRVVRASFDWTEAVDLDAALRQQKEMAGLVGDSQFVVKTAVLEEISDAWPLEEQRRAHAAHSGTLWLSDRGLALGRFVPLSPN